jgi:hypothetical protein
MSPYIITAIVLALIMIILIIVLWKRKQDPLLEVKKKDLDTQLLPSVPSKIDNLMVEANLPENFDYFIELLSKKLVETAKEVASKNKTDPDKYQGALINAIKQKFIKLNKTITKNKNGKLLVKELEKYNCSDSTSTNEVSDSDIEKVIDLNENLIIVVYPCLI